LSFFYDSSEKDGKLDKRQKKITQNKESGLKKGENRGILNDSDVVYPEYDVRKVPGSGSSGTPFFRLFVDTN
jgi:hypothetical protein